MGQISVLLAILSNTLFLSGGYYLSKYDRDRADAKLYRIYALFKTEKETAQAELEKSLGTRLSPQELGFLESFYGARELPHRLFEEQSKLYLRSARRSITTGILSLALGCLLFGLSISLA